MRIFDGVDVTHRALDYHLRRQNLLISNLSHVDTPGFRPLDLERPAFEGQLKTALAETQPGHLASRTQDEHGRVIEDKDSVGPDGNGVNLDKEAVKIATNNVRYDALANLIGGQLSSLAWAANDGRGG